MAKHKIRLTMRPDQELEVEGPELLDLQRQGLVLPSRSAPASAPDPDGPMPDVPAQRTRKTSNGGK